MMVRPFKSSLGAAAAASVVTALLVGGVAFASIPNSTTGTLTACYKTAGTTKGALRVIDYQAGARCVSGEAQLSWPTRGFSWRGPWVTGTAYRVNDVVRYLGSAYIAKLANTSVVPTNTTNWSLMASKGDTGAPGASGIVTTLAANNASFTSVPGFGVITGEGVASLYLAKAGEKAVVSGSISAKSTGSWTAYAVPSYSTDSGTSWTACSNGQMATVAAAVSVSLSGNCIVSMSEGLTYQFGMAIQNWAGAGFSTTLGMAQTSVVIVK